MQDFLGQEIQPDDYVLLSTQYGVEGFQIHKVTHLTKKSVGVKMIRKKYKLVKPTQVIKIDPEHVMFLKLSRTFNEKYY